MKKKNAIKAVAKKPKKVSVRTLPPKQWKKEDLKKMAEIILGASDPVLGQKLAAEHFGVSYAAIQCRWSRYRRGTNMGRIKSKSKSKKVTTITESNQPSKKLSTHSSLANTDEEVLSVMLDLITIRKLDINKVTRQITITY
jgi:hypothetical protein